MFSAIFPAYFLFRSISRRLRILYAYTSHYRYTEYNIEPNVGKYVLVRTTTRPDIFLTYLAQRFVYVLVIFNDSNKFRRRCDLRPKPNESSPFAHTILGHVWHRMNEIWSRSNLQRIQFRKKILPIGWSPRCATSCEFIRQLETDFYAPKPDIVSRVNVLWFRVNYFYLFFFLFFLHRSAAAGGRV